LVANLTRSLVTELARRVPSDDEIVRFISPSTIPDLEPDRVHDLPTRVAYVNVPAVVGGTLHIIPSILDEYTERRQIVNRLKQ